MTKAEAARALDLTYTHFIMKLKRAGLLDSVRTSASKYDSEAMEKAVEEALKEPSEGQKAPTNAEIARKHGIPASQYAAFSMRVLHARRSRMKADLRHDQTLDSGASGPG